MPKDCSAIDTELLLSQSGWVQSVSRNLVRDPLGAEDVAQETMLAALASPPRYAENAQQLRAWLGKVAFNLAHRNTRRNSRRRAREVRVAKSEELCSTVENVVRSTEIQRVSAAVGALDEPFQTAVRLYYFHRLSTAEIAERTGATDNAVRKRLWRARGKLRTLLDGEQSGRASGREDVAPGKASGVLGFFFPWLGSTRDSSQVAASGWFSSLGVAASVACAGLVSLAVFARVQEDASELSQPASVASSTADLGALGTPRIELGSAAAGLVAQTVTLPPPGESFEPQDTRTDESKVRGPIAPESAAPTGLLMDLAGRPVPGLRLAWSDALDQPFVSAEDGSFARPDDELTSERRLRVLTPGWTSLTGLIPESTPASDLGFFLQEARPFLVAPSADVHGLVLGSGEPLSGATLSVRATPAVLARLPFAVGGELSVGSGGLPSAAQSALDGRFELSNVPVGPGFELVARAQGFEELSLALETRTSGAGVVLTLNPLSDPEVFLRGLVLNEWGEPLEGAEIRLGTLHSTTDREGRFRLALLGGLQADPSEELVVAKEGHRTLRRPGFWRTRAARTGIAETVRFQLGAIGSGEEPGYGKSVEGRLVDELGRPVAGWKVAAVPTLDDPLHASEGGAKSTTIGDWGLSAVAESDEQGAFRLDELGNWTVVIRAWDPRGSRSAQSRPVLPGSSEVRIAVGNVDPIASEARLASALWGLESGPRPVRFVRRFRSPTGVWDVAGPVVWAGEGRSKGASSGHALPPTGTTLATVVFEETGSVPGDGQFGLPQAGMSVVRTAAFRVRSTLRGEGLSLRMFDEKGEALPLASGPLPVVDRVWLVEGRTPLLHVQDTARSLVLYREDREVLRLEVELASDSVTTLRP